MSTTLANSEIVNNNTACCKVPTVQHDYTGKGEYKSYADMDKVYMVGPEGTGKAIIIIYDIFGYFPQTLQGADLLADAVGARVLMPDFLMGKPWPADKFPPQTKTEEAQLQLYFGTTANPLLTVPYINRVAEELKKEGATKVGVLGFCWGGKLSIKCGSQSWVDGIAAIHPAMLTASDADNIQVPLALFPSVDEPVEEYEGIVKALSDKPWSDKNAYKVYPSVSHGFAAARANLTDPDGKAQFEDVYTRTAAFFKNVFES
ncbi:hypothetical protein FRC01_009436 [Tulasnella sp. 417]|nr:hypothetical protein FRC01_009436 [Tulasnella sp. 417]